MSTETELAWCAGFFDGEGSTGCYVTGGPGRIQMVVGQKHTEVLERFLAAVGVGHIKPRNLGHPTKQSYAWQTYKRPEVLQAGELIWPYLDRIKRAQYVAAWNKYSQLRHLDWQIKVNQPDLFKFLKGTLTT